MPEVMEREHEPDYCPKCRRVTLPVRDGRYCPDCGAELVYKPEPPRCQICNTEISVMDKFCPSCGSPNFLKGND